MRRVSRSVRICSQILAAKCCTSISSVNCSKSRGKEATMPSLKDFALYDIDWNLTPEHAVTMYLEWGNNDWHAEYPPVRSKEDVSHYFVVDSWQDPPVVRLVRRNSERADDLISVPLPDSLLADFRQAHGTWRGISEPTPGIKAWLKSELEQ